MRGLRQPTILSGISTMYAVIATGGKQYRVTQGRRPARREARRGAGRHRRIRRSAARRCRAQTSSWARRCSRAARSRPRSCATARATRSRIVKFRRRKHYLRQGTHRQPLHRSRRSRASAPAEASTFRGSHSWHIKRQAAVPERPRFPLQAPGREALRRRAGAGRQHHRAPARHAGARRARTSASAWITRCSPWSRAGCSSRSKGAEQRMYVSVVPADRS